MTKKSKTNTAAAIGSLMDNMANALASHSQDRPSPSPQSETRKTNPVAPDTAARSCTFRLTGEEVLKINAVSLATHQSTGARLTTTDILHVAIKNLPETAISREEVDILRTNDKRRRQL